MPAISTRSQMKQPFVLPDEMTFESRRELRLFEMEQALPYIVKLSRVAGRE